MTFKNVLKKIKEKYFCGITGDEDFDKVLRIHWIFGIVMKVKDQRKLKSVAFTLSIVICALLGTVLNLYDSYNENKSFLRPIIPTILIIRNAMISLEIFVFLMNINKLMLFIEKLADIKKRFRDKLADKSDSKNQNELRSLMRFSKIHIMFTVLVMIVRLVKTIMSKDKFVIFIIYENFSQPHWIIHFPLALINVLHTIIFSLMIISQDILLPVSISKLETMFNGLKRKVSNVTNHRNSKINEKRLNECIQLHIEALQMLNKFRDIFNFSILLRTFVMMILLAAAVFNTVFFIEN